MSRIALTVVAVFAISALAAAQAGTWQIDPNHSAAQFSVKHLGVSTVRGAFTKVSGSATYDPANPSKSIVDVSIDASSIDTRVQMRSMRCGFAVERNMVRIAVAGAPAVRAVRCGPRRRVRAGRPPPSPWSAPYPESRSCATTMQSLCWPGAQPGPGER